MCVVHVHFPGCGGADSENRVALPAWTQSGATRKPRRQDYRYCAARRVLPVPEGVLRASSGVTGRFFVDPALYGLIRIECRTSRSAPHPGERPGSEVSAAAVRRLRRGELLLRQPSRGGTCQVAGAETSSVIHPNEPDPRSNATTPPRPGPPSRPWLSNLAWKRTAAVRKRIPIGGGARSGVMVI